MDKSLKEDINTSKDDFQNYLEARLDMMRLNLAENFSKMISGFIIKTVVLVIFLFAMLFISFAVAGWLNSELNYPGIGFIIVAGFYLLSILVFWLLRHKLIEKPIIQTMIEIFFPPEHNFESEENE